MTCAESLAKHALIFVLMTTAMLMLVAGCSMTPPAQASTTSSLPAVNVSIQPDITMYTVAMSSAPGIGLTPNITGVPAGGGAYVYTWKTDYGSFLTWNAPDYVVREQGSTVTVPGGKVYWTYVNAVADATRPLGHSSRPLVHVSLDVIDAKTGSTAGHTERVITWTDSDMAIIT